MHFIPSPTGNHTLECNHTPEGAEFHTLLEWIGLEKQQTIENDLKVYIFNTFLHC